MAPLDFERLYDEHAQAVFAFLLNFTRHEADTRDLLQAALAGLRAMYREGPAYAKAGVILSQFVERGAITGDLFAPQPRGNSEQLMRVMDAINAKQGRGTIRLGRERAGGSWSMRRELLSPAYTSDWQGLPRGRC